MHRFSSSSFYNFELTRILGTVSAGGCDVAEFLEATAHLPKHDPEAWCRQWLSLAEKATAQGEQAASRHHHEFARKAFLRATNYFRAAPYMLFDPDPCILQCAERSIQSFERAITFFGDVQIIKLSIPLHQDDGTEIALPGYLVLPPVNKRLPKTPVIVNCGGADSTKEELYFLFGASAPQTGYAVLLFDGPGQGIVLKRDRIRLRADFETVSSAVLDHLWAEASSHPEWSLDLSRVAVAGASLGAHFALRAAAADKEGRIAACVSVDPIYSLWELAATRMPGWYLRLWMAGWLPESLFDWSCWSHMRIDFATAWEFHLCMWIMGINTPGNTLRAFQRYTLEDSDGRDRLGKIRCPTFVTGAPDTIYANPALSTLRIMKGLTAVSEEHKEIWIPRSPGDGSLTAKVGAWDTLTPRVVDFLDRQMGVERT